MKENFDTISALVSNVSKVIVGKDEVIRLLVAAMLARGHVLLEDTPGVGKTMLARALARSIDCDFKRIQCTPDLLPVDVTGYIDPRTREFLRGPVFAQVVLADELNRATPRTQSALLEAMGEGQVTVEGITNALPDPFLVIATQNPIEHRGVNDLPEAQLDRFMMLLTPGYPNESDELQVMMSRQKIDPLNDLRPVMDVAKLRELIGLVPDVRLNEQLIKYIVTLVRSSRQSPLIDIGASPRSALHFMRLVQAHALIQGRNYVIPDDIKSLAVHVLSHRIFPASFSKDNMSATDWKRECIRQLVAQASPPDS